MSFESDLNIAGSDLLEDEEGLSGELGDDELEQVSGGPIPALVWLGGAAIVGLIGLGVGKGYMDAKNEDDKITQSTRR